MIEMWFLDANLSKAWIWKIFRFQKVRISKFYVSKLDSKSVFFVWSKVY